MSDASGGPVALSNRVELLDVLRGFAVGGILLSNIGWFSGYGILPATLAATAPVADRITALLVHFLYSPAICG
jgi:uncharacterized protein